LTVISQATPVDDGTKILRVTNNTLFKVRSYYNKIETSLKLKLSVVTQLGCINSVKAAGKEIDSLKFVVRVTGIAQHVACYGLVNEGAL
jgi:hypothetical protein